MVEAWKLPSATYAQRCCDVHTYGGLLFLLQIYRMNMVNSAAGNLLQMMVTEGVTVNILPNGQYEYLMTVSEVANGYGTTKYSIFQAIHNHPDELIENKHLIRGIDILYTPTLKGIIQPNSILLTKRGIVRIGFFIKSERAKLFRDWAEELIIKMDQEHDLFGAVPVKKALPAKRNHNRITQDRLIRLLQLTHRIDDSALRNDIVNELMGGHAV